MPDLLATWSNAVDKLANDHSPYILAEVRTLISAIDAEWETRAAQFISDEDYFAWPGTDAHPGDGSISAHDWQVLGPLRYLGYQAGTTADLAAPVRRAILSRVFEGAIPPAFPPSYLRTWGQPGSVLRLQKMAESIASFVRNGKRRDDGKMDAAVADWEADLQFLYDRYYVARFRFAWPTLRV